MTILRTNIGQRENARSERFEPTGAITQTNVQKAVEQVSTQSVARVGNARLPAAAGTVAILTSDIEVGIDSASGVTSVTLPSASAWATANPNGLELTIFDYTGHASANNITPSLNGADVFVEGVTPVISQDFGVLKLRPVGSPINAWKVRGLN